MYSYFLFLCVCVIGEEKNTPYAQGQNRKTKKKIKMGDVQRRERLTSKIRILELCILQTQNERNYVNQKMQQSEGDLFLDYFQEVAEIDQLIFNLKKEKQRIINLL